MLKKERNYVVPLLLQRIKRTGNPHKPASLFRLYFMGMCDNLPPLLSGKEANLFIAFKFCANAMPNPMGISGRLENYDLAVSFVPASLLTSITTKS